MFTSFTLLALAGGAFRFGTGLLLARKWNLTISLPQLFAVGLVVLAALPDLIKPLPFPFPLGLTLGFVLPDLIIARRS
ncbi:hypothetical protein [Celeribacter neptunius]|uniref:Uncharacterized protein n=1 Tax=Celeribacter neptunius TaxID=588602 RepID=A0A1I3SDN1_9RHOB|nr:hypothetical protein [Celeribacter neptunius]SFJ55637.1 hypothetical protein SAMN04487991_2392 [Celeribacter neptunius]